MLKVKQNAAPSHPDGLIHAVHIVGTKNAHDIELWNSREQALASTMKTLNLLHSHKM